LGLLRRAPPGRGTVLRHEPAPPRDAVSRACPVVGSYTEKDFTARSGRKLDGTLERHGIPHDVKIYRNARHSFFNDESRNHDPAASEDSWRRTLAFFEEHIG
jgi:carboxymethylenebutenolidase